MDSTKHTSASTSFLIKNALWNSNFYSVFMKGKQVTSAEADSSVSQAVELRGGIWALIHTVHLFLSTSQTVCSIEVKETH